MPPGLILTTDRSASARVGVASSRATSHANIAPIGDFMDQRSTPPTSTQPQNHAHPAPAQRYHTTAHRLARAARLSRHHTASSPSRALPMPGSLGGSRSQMAAPAFRAGGGCREPGVSRRTISRTPSACLHQSRPLRPSNSVRFTLGVARRRQAVGRRRWRVYVDSGCMCVGGQEHALSFALQLSVYDMATLHCDAVTIV